MKCLLTSTPSKQVLIYPSVYHTSQNFTILRQGSYKHVQKGRTAGTSQPGKKLLSTCDDTLNGRHTAAAAAAGQVTGKTPLCTPS